MGISVKLDVFEGPLDLLLHLIDKNKVDIYDIPIALITEQYLDYIGRMETRDMDVMSEFLVMASTLVNLKSQMLLPRERTEEGEEADPRAELVERLLEYKMYKYMSYELKDRQIDASRVIYREPAIPDEIAEFKEEVDLGELLSDLTLAKLHEIFKSVVKKQSDKVDPIRSKFGRIEKEEVSLNERLAFVENYARVHKSFSFRSLLEAQCGKMEVIVTFLAVLELMKAGTLLIEQENTFDDIFITFADGGGEIGD